MKLLLHACCGPCSLEPVRLLQEAGHELTIAYMNPNIAPDAEYERRRHELCTWAHDMRLHVIEGRLKPEAWEKSAGRLGQEALVCAGGNRELLATNASLREARCRACYRLRFEEVAQSAAEQHFDAIGTTLSVSPYQFSSIICEELERAALQAGVKFLFEDYRPYYDAATRRSREMGMYRQNYCGCRFSREEAAAERALRKRQREEESKTNRAAQAEKRAALEVERATQRAQKQAYAEKQARKRAALQAFKQQNPRQK